MNLTQLKCFWEVVNTGSFSEASENLYISQSAVSKNILALEKQLELRLFDRRGRKATLTPEGLKLAKIFGEIIKNYESAEMLISTIKADKQVSAAKAIKFSGIPTVGTLGILAAINSFLKEQPETKVPISIMEEDAVILSLQSGECDVAFCSSLKLHPSLYSFQKFSTHRFKIFLSPSNELAERTQITMADLFGQVLIVPDQSSMLRELCVASCEAAGFTPEIILSTNRPEVALNYAISSNYLYMGIDLFQDDMMRLPDTHSVIELKDSPTFDYVFAWKRDKQLNAHTKELLNYLIKNSSVSHTSF